MYPTTTKIAPTQRPLVSLAGLPAAFREEALASSNNQSSPLILTNGLGLILHPSEEQENQRAPVHTRAGERWEAAHQLPPFPYELSWQDKRLRPHAERDWVLGMLREVLALKGIKWETLGEKGYWQWLSALKREIIELEGIEDTPFAPYKELDFMSCGAWKSMGRHLKYIDGSEKLSPYSCSNPLCTKCSDRERKRTARKLVKKILAAAKAQRVKRFWAIVITFPQEFEHLPVKGSDLLQSLFDAIQKYLRKLFGLKTRDGLFAYCNVHAVGDENLFRDRFHFHCGVLPLATRKEKGETRLIHCDFETFKADLNRAKSLLADHLEKVLPGYDRELTQINFTPIVLKDQKKNLNKLMHRLRYDLRGFGKDIEQAPIFFDPDRELVVVKQGNDGYGVFTFRQMAERWKWIREQRCRLRTWGLLHQWNKYLELLNLEYVPDPEPEIVEETEITIIRNGGRQWNPRRRRVEWVNERIAIDENGAVIHNVKWGRKGSDGFWRPRTNGKPTGVHET